MLPADFLLDIRKCADSEIIIKHNPDTARYRLAAMAGKSRVKNHCKLLGWNDFSLGGVYKKIEIITWTEPLNPGSSGLYVCFKLFYTDKMELVEIILFCYYDGKENSPVFKNEKAAREYMKKHFPEYKEIYHET